MAGLKVGNMRLWWVCCCLHSGKKARLNLLGVVAGWKPILWYTKGGSRNRHVMIEDVVSGGREKSVHNWQQAVSEATYFIKHLTEPDEMILDPMCGSGTTCIAARDLGRRWIGCDIDSEAITIAAQRLESR